jgi:F-box and WD-40 domain protein 1/11
LQFDARRIICCSQNKVIVGWDFANGEKELEKIGDWSVETA